MSPPPSDMGSDDPHGADLGAPGHDGAWLAAEYALGVMPPQASAAAAAREAQDPAFAAEVQGWRERLQPLLDALPPQTPSAEVWPRIRDAIDREIARPATSLVREPVRPPAARRPRLWGAGLIAAGVAGLAVLVGVRTWVVNEPALTAVLTAPAEQGGAPMYKARLEPRRHRVILTALSGAPGASERDKSRELWLIPADGKPRPAGLIDPSRSTPLPLDAMLLAHAQPKTVLAVSVEPAGGSPSGLPTGPVIAAGPLAGA